jgi:Trypsin-like peptidase domain/Gram-negative bacterial TonB protein C-terminal
MPIKLNNRLPVKAVAAIALIFCPLLARAASSEVGADRALLASVCQVVYPLDQFPAANGYGYVFYGDGFFINEQGYLITAAHVVSTFRYGGQPDILVGSPDGPRRLLEASLVAVDWEHDVAVLRVNANPLESKDKIAFLPLSDEMLSQGKAVLSVSLRPPDVENAHSLDAPLQDFSASKVVDYQFHWENGSRSELMLFTQKVVPGQSGSPLISADSHGVVGIVVGRWLASTVFPSGANRKDLLLPAGAALRIHYAISLLEQQHIAWHSTSESSEHVAAPVGQAKRFLPPIPLSVVATPYPPQAMFGGEVMLDAAIDSSGKLTDLRVVIGDPPFLETVLGAVRTWIFSPARQDGRAVDGRLGIIFQFPQSFLLPITSRERKYAEPLADSADRGALPVLTVEPDYPVNSIAEGSVALYARIDAQGQITSTSVVNDVESLSAPTKAALRQWRFVPGKQAGAKTDSAVAVVITFRRPALR